MGINIWDQKAIGAMNVARLSAQQWEVLLILFIPWIAAGKPEPYRPKTKSRSESAAVSRMLRRLEERGFIVRIADGPSRRRTGGAMLTVAGLAFMEKATGYTRVEPSL
jgi:hypothetical protein